MADRFIVFDVETPNALNDRMSAIGITVIEDGKIISEIDTVVNPEAHFDSFNIELTGITPQMAKNAPTFPELWSEVENIFSSGVLAAHNAQFDMAVLAKCLKAYGITWKNTASYVCTCRMGRECYPRFENHRLDTMCRNVGIELDHHKAGSDSHAAACLLIDYLHRGVDWMAHKRYYDLDGIKTLRIGSKGR